jgi:predicted membrane protein
VLKWFLIIGSSLFWFPVLLFILVFLLSVASAIIFILLFGSMVLLLWLLKTIYKARCDLLLARQELIKEIGQELNNISWLRFGKMTLKRYWKKFKEEQVERKLKNEEKETDYE